VYTNQRVPLGEVVLRIRYAGLCGHGDRAGGWKYVWSLEHVEPLLQGRGVRVVCSGCCVYDQSHPVQSGDDILLDRLVGVRGRHEQGFWKRLWQ